MDKKLIDILRSAGDHYAANKPLFQTLMISALNPHWFADGDDEPRVSEYVRFVSVNKLLSLVRDSSGEPAAATVRDFIKFRFEMHEASQTPVILELDENKWLRCADLVLIRSLEVLAGNPLSQVMTTLEVERTYGLAVGSAKKAAQKGRVPAEKRGHDWLIKRTDAEAEWGGK